MFGCSDWGHIHRKADSLCAGTKIIPDRISVHIFDFDAISVTERSCAHVFPSIKWSVTYRKDFSYPQPQVAPNFLKRSFSPKFLKSLRRGTFKSTASVKCHFFFYNWTFWNENPLRLKSFCLWVSLCKYSPVVLGSFFIQGRVFRCLSPFWKTWSYFQTIDLKSLVVHLTKGEQG